MIKKIKKKQYNDDDDDAIKNKIILFLDRGDWKSIMSLIKDRKFTNLNVEIDNGNNLFHLACVKGLTDIIKEILILKKERKVTLNTHIVSSDGIPGIHLYYKYGGTDSEFFTSGEICYIDNNNNKVLIFYLINRIDLLEILVNKIIKQRCIDNIVFYDVNNLYRLLIKKITDVSKIDIELSSRYLEILKSIWLELKSTDLVFVAINLNSLDVIKMMINIGFDVMTYSSDMVTPLALAINNRHIEIANMILEYTKQKFGNTIVYKLIHASEREFNLRPIFIALANNDMMIIENMIKYMIPHLDEYYKNHHFHMQFIYENDVGRNTYLHKILASKHLSKIPIQIIRFFIKHTNLNQENYAGTTPAHMLFDKALWIQFKDDLIGRDIDLLKVDNIGNNCNSYVLEKNKDEFLHFTQQIKIPTSLKDDTKKMFNDDTFKSMIYIYDQSSTQYINKNTTDLNVQLSTHRVHKTHGLFNATLINYMLYLRYLETKYKYMFVPVRSFSKKNKKRDLFFYDLMAYSTSNKQKLLHNNVKFFIKRMYSYVPHSICWIDENQYYIDRDLINILKQHNQNVDVSRQRYIMLKFTIVVTESLLHANVLIYDRLNKEAWRFEPYGITNITNTVSLDGVLHKLIEEVYGKIKYHDPNDYLSGLNFQMVDGEDYEINKNAGDPAGYCLAWCMWFIDVVLAYPDKNVRDIMKNFFDRDSINRILSDEEGNNTQIKTDNHYLDFIRRYAHKLDNEKNNILIGLGIYKYHLYNSMMSKNMIKKITNIFKINNI